MSEVDKPEENKITQKQRMLSASGKEVPIDLFLYSCLEHERTLRAIVGAGGKAIQWPPLQEGGEDASSVSDATFSQLLEVMATWYAQSFPAMTSKTPIDHEYLSEVVPALVGFNHDLAKLYEKKHGASLPEFKKSAESHALWEEIGRLMAQHFPHHYPLFFRYIEWSHATELVETFEPGSRPPVGRYAPPPIRSSAGAGGRSTSGSGPRRSEGEPSGRRQERSEGREKRGRHETHSDRPRNNGQRDRGRDRSKRKEHTGDSQQRSARMEESAMTDVNEALKALQQNGGVNEITLKPVNSFYRRIQHQHAVDAGFTSFSVGEGLERAVKITRKTSDAN